ncbi:MAG TPA: hypothetical protein VGE39_00740 [Prosthecobacter sp.]
MAKLDPDLQKALSTASGFSLAYHSALRAFCCEAAGHASATHGWHPAWQTIASLTGLAFLITSFFDVRAIQKMHAVIDARGADQAEDEDEA